MAKGKKKKPCWFFKLRALYKEVTLALLYNLKLFLVLKIPQSELPLGAWTSMRSQWKALAWGGPSARAAWPAAPWTALQCALYPCRQRSWSGCPAPSSRSSSHPQALQRTRMRRLRGRKDPGLWANRSMIWARAISRFTLRGRILSQLWTLPPRK